MSYKKLKAFVKEQAIRGENPERLREGLLLNGWDEKDVNKAISDVYGFKKKILNVGFFIILLVLVISGISLFLIFSELYFDDEPTSIDHAISYDFEDFDSCKKVEDIYLKDLCYLKEIADGYDCIDLEGEEFFFCIRALESHVLLLYEE